MTRINTNVTSLLSQRVLSQNNADLNRSLERLSTGLRINRGKDDPAGLIASQNLRAEIDGLNQAVKNAERADQVVNIAEGGLQEVSSLLNGLQALITQTANTGGLSQEELEANQLQIDSILQTIDRVASATSFQGLKLLNGNMDYETDNISAAVTAIKVNGAKLSFGETRDVDVLVTTSAQVGGLLMSFAGASIALGGPTNNFVIEVAGAEGSRELTFASSTSLAVIESTINSFTDVTGVRASGDGVTGIRLFSDGFGSDEFVSVTVIDEGGIGTASGIGVYGYLPGDANTPDTGTVTTFLAADNGVLDRGQDVGVTINGIRATTKGTQATINTDFLDVELNLNYDDTVGTPNAAVLGAFTAFTINGGGADFQLSSRVNIGGRVSIGVGNVAARELGQTTVNVNGTDSTYLLKDLSNGRDLNVVDGNLTAAQKIVEGAIKEVSSLRGRLGAFQKNVIGATVRSLGVSVENTTAAESVIRDADFATESAGLTRAQILVQSSTQVLGIANQSPQNALQLLG